MSGSLHLAYVAVGANLADPVTQVAAAIRVLSAASGLRLLRASSLYRTAPVGIRGQPDFINAVMLVETALEPLPLLDTLFDIERRFGRRREFRFAPRTLDLDLLLYDDWVIDSQRLSLPHPRMHLRAFVLVPLLEIATECRIPGRGAAAAWLPAVSGQRIEKIVGSMQDGSALSAMALCCDLNGPWPSRRKTDDSTKISPGDA